MRRFARIEDGRVAELFATDAPMVNLFHPNLQWADVTGASAVAPGWVWDGQAAHPPPPVPPQPATTLADVQAQLTHLSTVLAAMAAAHP